jgi:hypothetical protein
MFRHTAPCIEQDRWRAVKKIPSRRGVRPASTNSSDDFQLFFNRHNIDLSVLAITRLVAKIKNASRKTKPFHTLFYRPDAVGFRQEIHEPAY